MSTTYHVLYREHELAKTVYITLVPDHQRNPILVSLADRLSDGRNLVDTFTNIGYTMAKHYVGWNLILSLQEEVPTSSLLRDRSRAAYAERSASSRRDPESSY
jgi:hypothetical protein